MYSILCKSIICKYIYMMKVENEYTLYANNIYLNVNM